MKLKKNIKDIAPYTPGIRKPGAIKLASNENPFGPSPRALDAMNKYILEVNIYPDKTCQALRDTIALKWGIKSEEVIVGNGSDEILLFAALAYLEPGDNVLAYQSTFSLYATAAQLLGAQVRRIPFINRAYQLDRVPELVDKKTRLVFLCNPNNPTGTYFSHTDLVKLLNTLSSDILVVVDEAYADFAEADDFPQTISLVNQYDNLLVLRTFSKLYGLAGLRIGYGLGCPGIIADLDKTRMPFNSNALAQVAGQAALDDEAFVAKTLSNNAAGKKYLYQELDRLGLAYYPTQANFIFVDLKTDCQPIFQQLMDLGVTVRALTSFGFEQAIRVTVGTPDQNRLFIEYLGKTLASNI
jgi:histidinol-phosphate aminotransferase